MSCLDDDQFSSTSKKVIYKPGFFKNLFISVACIFMTLKNDSEIDLMHSDKGSMKLVEVPKNSENSSNYYTSNDEFSFDTLRKCYSKYEGITFNDFMLGIISKSLYQICKDKNIEGAHKIKTSIPITMKAMASGYDDLVIDNYILRSRFTLPIEN